MVDLLKGNTNKALVSMSMPISVGMLSTFLFQIIDTYFVGELGLNALAALSFASTLYFLLVGLFMGFSVGVSIIIGKAVGLEDRTKVKQTIMISIIVCFILTTILSFSCIVFVDQIFTTLGVGKAVLPLVKEYILPMLIGIPLLTVGVLCGSILRTTGNVTKPEVLMVIAGVINLTFDYGLIFGKFGLPRLGIKGAAYATVLSWCFVIVGMLVLLLKDNLLTFTIKSRRRSVEIVKEIFKLSTPSIVTQVIAPITQTYLIFLLARQSSMAVAAFGVAGRIEMLLLIGILGVSTAITPFIAQNYGALKKGRVEEAVAFAGRASTYIGFVVIIVLFLFIKKIAGLFSEDIAVIDYTSIYFYIVGLSYMLYGLYLVTTSIFNGLELPFNSLRITLVKTFAFTVPLTLIGAEWGVWGIFVGLSISNVFAGLYAALQMRKDFKRVNSSLASVNIAQEYLKDFKRLISKFWR